ncbi:P-loop containing nucleoside triphosphate hydrolase protein [Phycomyces nitens]|nr:P-loop containing nucleoside triphosphate hydrolase protein [Phycomyces nitens]
MSSIKRKTYDGSSEALISDPKRTKAIAEADFEADSDEQSSDDDQNTQSPIYSTNKTQINEFGTISRVEVKDFMCHAHLKVDFGPKINFVIGHNGSGKSAILTALTIALGAKATSTNRGKKLSSFIREGEDSAVVIVHLTNKGPDAYKPDVYGDTIQVERRISKDGLGTYKIKNSSGKIVSTKKEELTAICDYMSIQVDNPLTILSQDNARQFLNSSTSQDKYKLFMRATLLSSLMEDYDVVRESIDTTRTVVDRKKQCLPDLQKKALEAEARYKGMIEAREIDDKIDNLNNEIVWAQIIAKEKQAEKHRRNVVEIERTIEKSKEEASRRRNKIAHFEQEIDKKREEISGFKRTNQPNNEEKHTVRRNIIEHESKLRELAADIREINENVKQARARIQKCDRDIAAETAKLESVNKPRKEANAARLVALESKEIELIQKGKDLLEERTRMEQSLREAKDKYRSIDYQVKSAEKEVENAKYLHKELVAQKADRLRAFGHSMPDVVSDIKRESRWTGRTPVGPFGAYLQLSHPEYAPVLEIVLGKILNAFVVENFNDRNLLNKILTRRNMGHVSIYVAEYDIFSYAHEEPDEKYLTIVRAIKFENEWVKRQMIIANNIEKTLLMENRSEADKVMYNPPRNVNICFTKECQNVGARTGMRTESLQQYRGAPRFKKDIEPEIIKAREDGMKFVARAAELKSEQNALRQEIQTIEVALSENENARYTNESAKSKVSREISLLKEEEVDEGPQNIQAYVQEKENCENQVKLWAGQFSVCKKIEKETNTALGNLRSQLDEIEKGESEASRRLYELQEDMDKLDNMKLGERRVLKTVEDHIIQLGDKLNHEKRNLEDLESICKEWVSQAIVDYPNRVETTESLESLQRKIAHLDEARRRKEEEVGATLEEVEKEARDTLTAWHDAKISIKRIDELIKKMNTALKERMKNWDDFYMYITLAAKGHFAYYMHKRGDSGQLRFDQKKEILEIKVSTGDQSRKGSKRQKDSRSLSGGEKSFSQISLLLALWQGISSPIICLDEFDVYMDAVNRKQSMKMIIDSASDNSSQYILITPQDASNMTPGPFVTVHRLADPKRNN